MPLLYGRMIVGSAVISAGINAEDYAPATAGISTGAVLGDTPMSGPYDMRRPPAIA